MLWRQIRAGAALARAMLLIPPWLFMSPGSERARRLERAFFSRIARGFGIRIASHGALDQRPGTLYIMNHISWADIPIILALLDADFVAKSEIVHWPLIGFLARRFGLLFIERHHRQSSVVQADAIRDRLRLGRSVIICAEGTTGDGSSVLPFRTSLFAAADAANIVQPVCLRYLTDCGATLSERRLREIAWIDDDGLLSGALRLSRAKSFVRVDILLPLAPKRFKDRKHLAEATRIQIMRSYAAAPKRIR